MSLFNRITAVVLIAGCAISVPRRAAAADGKDVAAEEVAARNDGSDSALSVYSRVGRRDPFAGAKAHAGAVVGKCRKAALPYAADRLKLVFTATATSRPVALVVDPANIGHLLTIGDVVGHKCAVVSAISHVDLTLTDTPQALGSSSDPVVHRLRMAPQVNQRGEPGDFEGTRTRSRND